MTLPSFLSASSVHDLGWTLLHFLWQGLLLAAALELGLSFLRSANARHNLALATLVLMTLAPLATFFFLHGQGSASGANGAALTPSAGAGSALGLIVTSAAPSPWTNWLVLLWLSGIVALSLRALGGWVLVETLRRQGTEALPAELMERCRALQKQLAVTRPVRFLQSLRVSMPVVVGWFRPVILLPVSALAGLPPQQLDAKAKLEPGGGAFDISFTLDEGKQYRIGQVIINSKIAALLTPMLSFKSGDIYDQSKLQAALNAAPPQVRVHLQRDPDGKPILDLVIDLDRGAGTAPVPGKTGANAPKLKTAFLVITDDKGVQPPINIQADRISHDGQGLSTL